MAVQSTVVYLCPSDSTDYLLPGEHLQTETHWMWDLSNAAIVYNETNIFPELFGDEIIDTSDEITHLSSPSSYRYVTYDFNNLFFSNQYAYYSRLHYQLLHYGLGEYVLTYYVYRITIIMWIPIPGCKFTHLKGEFVVVIYENVLTVYIYSAHHDFNRIFDGLWSTAITVKRRVYEKRHGWKNDTAKIFFFGMMRSRQNSLLKMPVLLDAVSKCNAAHSNKADTRVAPSQWKTSLHSNAVSHWLGTNLESALFYALQTLTSFLVQPMLPHKTPTLHCPRRWKGRQLPIVSHST